MGKLSKVEPGEVFLAHNKYMNPPKDKFHLCINERMYLLINTKAHAFNCEVSPEDCSLLSYKCYINCSNIRIEPIKEFKIIKKEQLSIQALLRLLEKIKCTPTLSPIQQNLVIRELENCIKQRN